MDKALPFFIIIAVGAIYLYATRKNINEYFADAAKMPISTEQTLAQTAPRLPKDSMTTATQPFARIASLRETLSLFLSKEGSRLQVSSTDSAIILPLQRAYADKELLDKEVATLERNPSAPQSITPQNIIDIESNLQHLRNIVAKNISIEGFENEGARATPTEIKEFSNKVNTEIIRLGASGTTDPVITARINALRQMSKQVEEILLKVQTGLLKPEEIPIYQSDIEKSLPALGNPSSPLLNIIKMANLPLVVESMLPQQDVQDPQSRQMYADLIDKYADTVVNGLSWNLSAGIKYTAPYEVLSANSPKAVFSASATKNQGDSTVSTTGFPTEADLQRATAMDSTVVGGPGAMNIVNDIYAANPLDENRQPAQFDWHGLAAHICNQIRLRGLNPSDFGCMDVAGMKNAPGGSWRGYTRMICTRLSTTTDPGLPEMCGCPPDSWRGWGAPRW